MRRISELAHDMLNIVGRLEDRLAGVLRAPDVADATCNPKPMLVPLAEFLDQSADTIKDTIRRVESIMNRLEV